MLSGFWEERTSFRVELTKSRERDGEYGERERYKESERKKERVRKEIAKERNSDRRRARGMKLLSKRKE